MHTEEIKLIPDTNHLKTFLSFFNFKLITVSIQPEETKKETARLPKCKYFNMKNRVRAVPPSVFFSDVFQEELAIINSKDFAIYFTINEGDGVPADKEDGNFNCGRRTNIKMLKTLAIDTDEADCLLLDSKLKQINLKPHVIVESSKGRFHYYFLIEELPAEGDNILQWKAMQTLLDNLIPKLDQSLRDINQVLRLPSFFNQKAKPVKVSLYSVNPEKPYNLAELYTRLGAHVHNEYLNGSIGDFKNTYTKFEFPKTKLLPGNRRNTICRYIEHIMENILPITAPIEDYFTLVDAFIIKNLSLADADEFLEGGKRRANIEAYFRDQLNYRLRKHQSLQAISTEKEFQHQEALETEKLPDSFYLNFPGDLGLITREIHNYSPSIALELCFAGALCISGALKAESFRFQGAWPFVNGLIIAGTGVGKSTLKDIIERTLEACGLRGKYPQLIGFQNTVQSLHTALYAAGGAGTSIVDESGDYLQMITSKNAPGYAKALKKYYKEATTGKDKGTWLSPGGSLSYNVPAIQGGMLSLWLMIQPGKFSDTLNIDDMADGFLPRFFIFNGKADINLTHMLKKKAGSASFKPSMDFQVYLESLSRLVSYSDETSIKVLIDNTEKEFKENYPKAKIEQVRFEQRDAVYRARSEARNFNTIQVEIDEDAENLLLSYLEEKEVLAREIARLSQDDAQLGVYIRIEEMLMRFLCNAATYNQDKRSARIDFNLVDQAIQFHRFQTDRFFRNEFSEMNKGSSEKEADTVMKGLKHAVVKAGGSVTLKQITLCIRGNARPKNIGEVLKGMIARQEVWVHERPHAKIQTRKVHTYMPAQSEETLD